MKIFTSLCWVWYFDRVNHSKLIFITTESPCRIDIYVGPPTFFLGPAVAPHFLNSRIATVHSWCELINKSLHFIHSKFERIRHYRATNIINHHFTKPFSFMLITLQLISNKHISCAMWPKITSKNQVSKRKHKTQNTRRSSCT